MSTTEQVEAPTSRIESGVTIPQRSRIFTDSEVTQVIEILNRGENAGYGTFKSANAARSAGVALNRLIESKGQPKRATTVFQRGDEYVGAILPKAAKVVKRKPRAAKKGGK